MTKKSPGKAPKAAKPIVGTKSKGKGKAAGAAAAGMAGKWVADALKDPETRVKLIEQGKDAAEWMKQKQDGWKAEKAVKDAEKKAAKGSSDDLELLDALKRRPRRVHRLRRAINEAVAHDPELKDAAKPYLQRLKKLEARIATAEGMTKTLRKAEYKIVDARLEEFELDLITDLFGPALGAGG